MRSVAKQWGRWAATWGYHASGEYSRYLRGKWSILTYHRVLPYGHPDLEWVQPGMYVSRDSFDRHLRFLKSHCEVVSLTDVLSLWREGCWDKNARYCTITFDDGWLDNYEYAKPLLRSHGVPATIFLPTSWIGSNEWFWPDRLGWLLCKTHQSIPPSQWSEICAVIQRSGICLRHEGMPAKEFAEHVILEAKGQRLSEINVLIETIRQVRDVSLPTERRLMNWAEVEEWSRDGVSFGSHACTHTLLTQLTSDECAQELRDSNRMLKEHNLNPVPIFCYPNGSYNEAIVNQVAESGYSAAVTTRFGHESSDPINRYQLHRIGMHEDVSADEAGFIWRMAVPDRRVAQWIRELIF